jgi:predicted AlkP superfamily pyrophosphatase or phosphodiesterase
MKKRLIFLPILLLIVYASTFFSQTKKAVSVTSKPKLVVGIVVDQMRNDYIYRYWNRYGIGGFKRLVNDGYYFKNAH